MPFLAYQLLLVNAATISSDVFDCIPVYSVLMSQQIRNFHNSGMVFSSIF